MNKIKNFYDGLKDACKGDDDEYVLDTSDQLICAVIASSVVLITNALITYSEDQDLRYDLAKTVGEQIIRNLKGYTDED